MTHMSESLRALLNNNNIFAYHKTRASTSTTRRLKITLEVLNSAYFIVSVTRVCCFKTDAGQSTYNDATRTSIWRQLHVVASF